MSRFGPVFKPAPAGSPSPAKVPPPPADTAQFINERPPAAARTPGLRMLGSLSISGWRISPYQIKKEAGL